MSEEESWEVGFNFSSLPPLFSGTEASEEQNAWTQHG